MIVFCRNHPNVPSRHEGLCQPCLNLLKKHAPTITAAAVQWTAASIKKTFGHACGRISDGKGGYYMVNGAKGMHLHVYGSDDGVHVKVGMKAILIISVKGDFLSDGWQEAVDAVMARATGDLRLNLLAAMAIILSERGGGLSADKVAQTIAALPIPPADQ
jgi:hypothetical protein